MDESFPPQCLREYRSFVSWWFTLPGSPRGRCPNQNNIVLIKSRRQAADVKHTQASLTVWVLPLPSIGICKSNLIRSWKDFERRYWGVFLSFRCRCLHLLVWLRKESRQCFWLVEAEYWLKSSRVNYLAKPIYDLFQRC